jgi:hypothetical protein
VLSVADRVALVQSGRLVSCRKASEMPLPTMNGQDAARMVARAANFRRSFATTAQAGNQ